MSTPRLSRLQRRILVEAVALMRNTCDPEDSDFDFTYVPRRAVFEACRPYWPEEVQGSWRPEERAKRSSFDRALRTLIKKGLLGGLALAWIDPECPSETRAFWQGGDKPRVQLIHVTRVGLEAFDSLQTDAA